MHAMNEECGACGLTFGSHKGGDGSNLCPGHEERAAVQKRGKPLLRGSVEQAPADMGIDWMQTWDEVREAIPPAYTEFIGGQLLEAIRRAA